MLAYLIRHAHAVSEKDHPQRPLSDRGRDEVRRLAAFLKTSQAFAPAQIWHSPLLRSRETATALINALGSEAPLVEIPGLLSEDDPQEVASRLAAYVTGSSVALVGHEPQLGALGTLLVRGKQKPLAFELKKGAILALARTNAFHKKSGEPRWQAIWHVVPQLLPDYPSR